MDDVGAVTLPIDCFWCGDVLFQAGDRLVCPSDAATFAVVDYLRIFTPESKEAVCE